MSERKVIDGSMTILIIASKIVIDRSMIISYRCTTEQGVKGNCYWPVNDDFDDDGDKTEQNTIRDGGSTAIDRIVF